MRRLMAAASAVTRLLSRLTITRIERRVANAALHPPSLPPHDPDAARGRGAGVLPAAAHAGRPGARCCCDGDGGQHRARSRSPPSARGSGSTSRSTCSSSSGSGACCRAISALDVDRQGRHRRDRDPARAVAAGRDHGHHPRRAARAPARHALGHLQGHLDRPDDPRLLHRGARRALVLARHDRDPAAAHVVQLDTAAHLHAVLRTRWRTCRS